ncbi:hypothetical protein ABID65_006685 [Bradyrhizobium sp. S3.9.2]
MIAARQRHILLDHLPDKTRLRIADVRALFEQMRDSD